MNGWIIIDKPLGLGSTGCVTAVKRALREGKYLKCKIGHGGTLDPLATGVLPIALGEATKLAGRMLDSDKVYSFTINFGTQTNTLDLEGSVIASSIIRPSLAAITAILPQFTGPISQMPPAYSALKVDGQRAHSLARAGIAVELQMRDVIIHNLEIDQTAVTNNASGERADTSLPEITLIATVSKGTYIRALARDIALALDTVGTVTMLHRLKAGPFNLSQAISLDKLAKAASEKLLEACLLPLSAALDDIPVLALNPDQAIALRVGKKLFGLTAPDGLTLAMIGITPVALVIIQQGIAQVKRGFNINNDVEDEI